MLSCQESGTRYLSGAPADLICSLLRNMCFNTVKNDKIQLKLGNLLLNIMFFVIVLRQICSYILNKLQLMSATVFSFLRVQHLFFEGKKKNG